MAASQTLVDYHTPRQGVFSKLKKLVGAYSLPEPRPELVEKAFKAIDRITSENSELAELWAEGEDAQNEWLESVTKLRSNLKDCLEMSEGDA